MAFAGPATHAATVLGEGGDGCGCWYDHVCGRQESSYGDVSFDQEIGKMDGVEPREKRKTITLPVARVESVERK